MLSMPRRFPKSFAVAAFMSALAWGYSHFRSDFIGWKIDDFHAGFASSRHLTRGVYLTGGGILFGCIDEYPYHYISFHQTCHLERFRWIHEERSDSWFNWDDATWGQWFGLGYLKGDLHRGGKSGADASAVSIPLWMITFVLSLCTLMPLTGWRRRRREQRGLCVRCGYNLTGNVSGVCPECGAAAGR